jgi:sphingomyelin phosphodiesterase acid-like 3
MALHRLKAMIAILLWMALILSSPILEFAQAETGEFLLISDIHFDPFYDGTLFDELEVQPVKNWSSILERSRPPGFNPIGTDSNYALLKSSLDETSRRAPSPDFILYPGDFMAHRWQSKYDRLAKKSHLTDPEAYRSFTSKAIQFVAGEFHRRYPRTPILPTLGNDDSYCGDYMITPDGTFLEMFAKAWAPLLGPDADREAFRATFSRGGNFETRLPRSQKHRLVSLNSIFFSTAYNNACGSSMQTPALDQLRWLAAVLKQAHAAGETVWLLMHIPPGINSFNTSESVHEGGPAITFWQPELTSQFLELIGQYQSTIQGAFAGHAHMDDFRVLWLNGLPALFIKIAPAISPIFGNNPGYQVYEYDRETGVIQNYRTYYLTLPTRSGNPIAPDVGQWAFEYDFRQTYGFSALNPSIVAQLGERIGVNAEVARHYTRFYSVSAVPEITVQTIGVYRCAISNVTRAEFQTCYRGVAEPLNPPPVPGRKVLVEAAP